MFESGITRRHVRDLYKRGLTVSEISEKLQVSKIWAQHTVEDLIEAYPALETRHYLVRHGMNPAPRVEARFVCVEDDHAEPDAEWVRAYEPVIL